MLMIARREGEVLEMTLSPKIDPSTPIGEVLGTYPIRFKVDKISGGQVKLAIDAPKAIRVMREEIVRDETPS